MISLLSSLNKIKPVWVELGLQTLNEDTAKYINRCYENKIYFDIVDKLKKENIKIITHVILGLPNESKEEMLRTVDEIKDITDGIKFTVLHVLKNTKLESLYNENKYTPLELKEYVEILGECIKKLPKNVVVHRMTGDGSKRELIAPKWTENKKYVLQYISDYFDQNNIEQGKEKAAD